jgi:hypothetical protein
MHHQRLTEAECNDGLMLYISANLWPVARRLAIGGYQLCPVGLNAFVFWSHANVCELLAAASRLGRRACSSSVITALCA